MGGEEEVIMKYIDNGLSYLHRGDPVKKSGEDSKEKSVEDPKEKSGGQLRFLRKTVEPSSVWKDNENGSIPCPPVNMGGCGCGNLELKCTLPEDWVAELLIKAEDIANVNGLADELNSSSLVCPRPNKAGEINKCNNNLRKASSREDSADNYLFCPAARDIRCEDLKHFQWHWRKGEPVIVGDVLETTSGLSWEPMVMWRAFRQITNQKHGQHLDVTALNCLDWCEVSFFLHFFSTVYRFLFLFLHWYYTLTRC